MPSLASFAVVTREEAIYDAANIYAQYIAFCLAISISAKTRHHCHRARFRPPPIFSLVYSHISLLPRIFTAYFPAHFHRPSCRDTLPHRLPPRNFCHFSSKPPLYSSPYSQYPRARGAHEDEAKESSHRSYARPFSLRSDNVAY